MGKRVTTRERRVNAANAQAAIALNLFRSAAADLDAAADTLDAVAVEVAAEINGLLNLKRNALGNAAENREAAARIRELVG